MEFVRLALLFLHIVGVSLLLGGFAVQAIAKAPRVNPAMVYGALTQVVTGVLLAAPYPQHPRDPAKLLVKGVIAVLIAAMVLVVRKKERVAPGHFYAIGGMTLLNVAVAVFW